MEKERGKQDPSALRESTETSATRDSHIEGGRRGPSWKGWVLSILVAIVLSVTATLLLGGSAAFRSNRATMPGVAGSGSGGSCCAPVDAGK